MTADGRRPGDDFYCWRYRVWYRLHDCVFRHAWQTTAECAACQQGAANLRLLGKTPPPPRWAKLLQLGVGDGKGGRSR